MANIFIERQCSQCGAIIKGRTSLFGKSVCFDCKQEVKKEWREKNWDKILAYQKKQYALRKQQIRK